MIPARMPKKYDIAVVGAGVFGAWTAFHLTKRGARVLIVDQHGPANSRASSGGETRIIRMSYGADEVYTRSALRSLELWKEFFPSMFVKTGVLVTSAASDPYLLGSRDTLLHCDYDSEWLEYSALRKRFANIRFDRGGAAVYEPGSGVLMARRSVEAVVAAAVEAGAHYETRRVDAPDRKLARAFVFACGPWLPKMFPGVIGARIRPTRQEIFFFGTPPGDRQFAEMPVWISFREGAYTIPAIDGRGFKVAIDEHGPPFDPETGDRAPSQPMVQRARTLLKKRFPELGKAPLLETRVCQYENTSNGDFLIDRHPSMKNVWLVGGGSGHGFKHGPYVGEYVTRQIAGDGIEEPRFPLASKGLRKNRTVY